VVTPQQKAIKLLTDDVKTDENKRFYERLESYKAGRSWRENQWQTLNEIIYMPNSLLD